MSIGRCRTNRCGAAVGLLAALSLLIGSGCKREELQGVVVCLGDSLTVCGGEGGRYADRLAESLPGVTIINKGIGGNTLADGRARFGRDVLDLKPDVVVIELGANDFLRKNRPIEKLKADLEDMVRRAREADIEVVIAGCFGRRDYSREKDVEFGPGRYDLAKAIVRMEEDICRRYDCFYVPDMQADIKPNGCDPYWSDYFHPNKKGNRYVADRILPELTKALKRAASDASKSTDFQ